MSSSFESKTAIVTGSSSGIGRATAVLLARQGATVCIVANRNVEGGQDAVRQIEDAGGHAIFVHADVSMADDCARIVEETVQTFGRLDVLINNAGITRGAPLSELDEDLWNRVMDTNLKAAYMMSRQAVPHIIQSGGGAVVNVSSVHAVASAPGFAVYAASKAGLCGLTRGLALEFGRKRVRFNCVLPGTIDTSLYSRQRGARDPATWSPRENSAQVMGRNGSPEEIASAIVFLASPESSFVNGASLVADGGLLSLLRDH